MGTGFCLRHICPSTVCSCHFLYNHPSAPCEMPHWPGTLIDFCIYQTNLFVLPVLPAVGLLAVRLLTASTLCQYREPYLTPSELTDIVSFTLCMSFLALWWSVKSAHRLLVMSRTHMWLRGDWFAQYRNITMTAWSVTVRQQCFSMSTTVCQQHLNIHSSILTVLRHA